MQRFLNFSIPFWEVFLILLGMAGGMFLMFRLYREQVFNYVLSLPDAQQMEKAVLSYGEQPSLSDPIFFQKVKDSFLAQKANFIDADLSKMKLSLYEDGVLALEVPILTKGREGSWWETPAGIYKILTKEENHFSTFGHVYQPWSMSFQGNFFIHGWPYYPDGTDVESKYSGGCIRLDTDDAKKVYALVKVGTPVLVFKNDFLPDNFRYSYRIPEISAGNYLATDIKNNFVFLEKNKTNLISLSPYDQFLGSLVATDYINIEKNIVLNKGLLAGVSGSRYSSGEKITPFDLLQPILLQSDTDSLAIFSNYLTAGRFTSLLSSKAKAIGMGKTDLAGGQAKTSAEDLFYLAKYLYNSRKFLLDLSAGRNTNMSYASLKFSGLENKNLFAEQKSFVGGKTTANPDNTQNFFGVFTVFVGIEKRPVFIYLDHSKNVQGEVSAILEYIQNSFR